MSQLRPDLLYYDDAKIGMSITTKIGENAQVDRLGDLEKFRLNWLKRNWNAESDINTHKLCQLESSKLMLIVYDLCIVIDTYIALRQKKGMDGKRNFTENSSKTSLLLISHIRVNLLLSPPYATLND